MILEVENLSVSYQVGSRWIKAVREVSLGLEAGQIYGVVGESGSGKSTVATAIMRYLSDNGRIEPDSRIRFLGEDLLAKSSRDMRAIWGRQIKLVPQNPGTALNPAMKIGEQVAEIARYQLNLSARQAMHKTIEMFERVRLPDPAGVASRFAHEISGGMQQRVLIAMALITEPQLLIMDEPTTGLDVTTEAVILDLVRDLIRDFKSGVVYVTHNLGVVAQLCDRVLIMYAGEVMVDGSVERVFASPLHPYSIGLQRSIPMLGQTKYDTALHPIEGQPPSLRDIPPGCVYITRCPLAIDICKTRPPLEDTQEGRCVRCHRWREIASGQVQIVEQHSAGVKAFDPTERERLLAVRDLTKDFPLPRDLTEIVSMQPPPAVKAVDGISLYIQKGRTLGLVGESGSGKTTLSRLITGLTPPTSGEVELMGFKLPPMARDRSHAMLAKMQMIFQNPHNSLNPYLTVGQAIRRPLLKLAGLSRSAADQEVKRLLKAVNLREEYANRLPGELSGGEKQRVVIARAFASHPELIICDEPVSALDVSVQASVLNLLANMQQAYDTSYLFISHDLSVVGYLADYLAVMYLGQLFEVGYAREMFTPPYHPYTEALISAIPIPDPMRHGKPLLLHNEIPNPRYMPTGCRFHTRCPYKLGAICETEAPPWQDNNAGHFIRCHIPLDELKTRQEARLGEG